MRVEFGLDLGSGGLRLVRRDRSGVRGVEARHDPELDVVERHSARVAALKDLCQQLGASGKRLNLAVPRSEALLRSFTLPDVPPQELEQLVRFQAAKELPFSIDEVALAWERLPGREPGELGPVQVAAVRESVLEDLRLVVREAGCQTGRIVVCTLAAARSAALAEQIPAQGETVLLEVGHGSSGIVTLYEGRLVSSRSASVGNGSGEGWAERLAGEVSRTLFADRAARGSLTEDPPAALLLGGGGGSDATLAESLRERVGAEPTLVDALTPRGPKDAGPSEEDPGRGLRFMVARGLVDGKSLPGIPTLDLAQIDRQASERSSQQKVLALGLVGLLILVGLGLGAEAYVGGLEGEVRELKRQKGKVAGPAEEAARVEQELALASSWTKRKGFELELLLAICGSLDGETAYLTQLRWREGGEVRVSGRAKDYGSVVAYQDRLKRDPLIERADFDEIRRVTGKGEIGVRFNGTVRLVVEAES